MIRRNLIEIVLLVIISLVLLCGCKQEVHIHSFSTEWSYDDESHWHDSTCGHDVISDKTVHIFDDGTIIQHSSCIKTGIRTIRCEECGFSKEEIIPISDHFWGTSSIIKESTCNESGEMTLTCTVCGESKSELIEPTGHSFSTEWSYDEESHWHDSTCGHVAISSFENHLFDDNFSCSICGYKEDIAYVFSITDDGALSLKNDVDIPKDLVIPDEVDGIKVTSIADFAFYSKRKLRSVSIPESVEHIGNYAFCSCTNLENVSFGQSSNLKSFGGYAFNMCKLSQITIPDSTENIGAGAFSVNPLVSVVIPYSVTNIGDEAFYLCKNLERISIPGSVTTIGIAAFWYCEKLETITIASSNSYYYSVDGMILSKDGTVLHSCPSAKGNVTIPESVIRIEDLAFADCRQLERIEFESDNRLEIIGYRSFNDCFKLSAIELPKTLRSIGTIAFASCKSLTSISIPATTKSIESDSFKGCVNLQINVEEENTNFSVDKGILYNKEKTVLLAGPSARGSIEIPETVQEIAVDAFWGSSITDVSLPNSLQIIRRASFWMCNNLKTVIIPDSVSKIEAYAFHSCSSLTSLSIGASVSSIEDRAFDGCCSLTQISFSGTVKQWAVIRKSDNWNRDVPAEVVICSDSIIEL